MKSFLGGRDRRALIIGAAIALPILAFRFGLQPYANTLQDVRSQLAQQHDLLGRELRVLAEAPTYPSLSQQAASALQGQVDRLFGGPDRLSATAALVNHVGTEARKYRVLVQQSETRPPVPLTDGVVALQVNIRGMSDLQGLLEFFEALERGTKLLRIEQIGIERARAVGAGAVSDEEVLSFSALVSGFALTDGDGTYGIATIGGGI